MIIKKGDKYGKLTAIRFDHKNNHGSQCWLFKCDCGKEKVISVNSVKNGSTKSCGCYKSEKAAERLFKHKMARTRFYEIWTGMKKRCLNKNCKSYKDYGGRGITICKEWLKFENFRDDMYQEYLEHVKRFGEKNTTVDRVKNNLGYYKENCQWSDMNTQLSNTRRNHFLTYKNKTQTIAQWAIELRMNYFTLHSRITRRGWSIEKSLTT